jgi:ABC-type Mn2+/Zn2+ transport system permease subunit
VNTLVEMLSPGFLLREALIGSVLVGCLCPLVGVYFVLRRMLFLGVALPQLSAAGIALAFLLYRMLAGQHQHFMPSERWLALLGSLSCTLLGLLVLAALARHRETVEARIGITYAIAAAATLLFLAMDPAAEAHMVNLLRSIYRGL